MSGITSSVGLFSGIDSGALINSLLQSESRPRILAQQRVVQLQAQQAAFLDLNSRLSALRGAATSLRTNRTFEATRATSSDVEVMTASARAGAAIGTHTMIVDRLVSTQSMLSRGYTDRDTSALGLTSMTIEGVEGRLDRDMSLSQMNGGAGIARGEIRVTDSSGATATIDLSRVATVNEVLEAFNNQSGVGVRASVEGGRFVLTNTASGTGTMSVTNAPGSTTATSLGIAGSAAAPGASTLTGTVVHQLSTNTLLQWLNDGNGVGTSRGAGASSPDFTITDREGTAHSVDVGNIYDAEGEITSAAPTTLEQLFARIATQTGTKVTASIDAATNSIVLTDQSGGSAGPLTVVAIGSSTAAADLGIVGSSSDGTLEGRRVLAELNSTLITNLRGGQGLDDGTLEITARDGSTVYDINLDTSGSVASMIRQISQETGGRVTASLDETGTGLILRDTTGGTGNFIVQGAAATAMGIETAPTGVAGSTVESDRLQHRYMSEATLLSALDGGRGIGTGRFEITDGSGDVAIVDIGLDSKTLGDVISEINSRGLDVQAAINDTGDGIILRSTGTGDAVKLKVRDLSGGIADALGIEGEAESTASNQLDGSLEQTITFDAADTLDEVLAKINGAAAGVRANVIRDGSTAPYRLTVASERSGNSGRFTIATAGADLALSTLSEGEDSRVFYGSTNAATGILLSSGTNQVESVIDGVTVNLLGPSEDPVTLSVTRDNQQVVDGVNSFVSAFNDVLNRIDTVTRYDAQTQRRSVLLGDSTAINLRSALFSMVLAPAENVSGPFQRLPDVGLRISAGGDLTIDEQKLAQALQRDPEAVAALFSARELVPREPTEIAPGVTVANTGPDEFTSLGVVERIARLADQYVNTVDGVLTRRRSSLDRQVKLQNDRIAQFDRRSESRRTVLEAQFRQMETALARMSSQSSALGGLRGLIG